MNNQSSSVWVIVAVLASMPMLATAAAAADPLQDFCVADNTSSFTFSGFLCRPAAQVSVSDSMSQALSKPGDTNKPNNAKVSSTSVTEFLGLNTLDISAARIDFAKGGINPPHTHPWASELLFLAKGELYVDFVDTNITKPRLFATTLKASKFFVFPKALVYFQLNVGNVLALASSALSSQNPGVQQVAAALFTPKNLNDEVLEKGFRISEQIVDMIQKEFRM